MNPVGFGKFNPDNTPTLIEMQRLAATDVLIEKLDLMRFKLKRQIAHRDERQVRMDNPEPREGEKPLSPAHLAIRENILRSEIEKANREVALLTTNMAVAERDVRWGHMRDKIKATRPDGCWCLGLGGDARSESAVDPWTLDLCDRYGIEPVEHVYREWCQCPDGESGRIQYETFREKVMVSEAIDRLDRLFKEGRIPPKCRDLSFESYPDKSRLATETIVMIRQWVENTRGWLYLQGDVGVGKTTFAGICLKELALKGIDPYYIRSAAFIQSIFDGFSKTGDGIATQIERYCDVGVLVIDDFGAEHLPEAVVGHMLTVLDYRLEFGKPTIITSNLPLNELEAHIGGAYGRRIVDRIKQQSIVVWMRGDSHRRPGRLD